MKKETTVPICIRIKKGWINYLKNKSREISYINNDDINFHDIIRNAIINTYPSIELYNGDKNE